MFCYLAVVVFVFPLLTLSMKTEKKLFFERDRDRGWTTDLSCMTIRNCKTLGITRGCNFNEQSFKIT